MKLTNQIKSLDRRIGPLRRKSSLLNCLYNHITDINVEHSFHSKKRKEQVKSQSTLAIKKLLEPTSLVCDSTELPKIIWMYWHSGFDTAPEVVHLAVRSWQEMNPGYEVRLLTDKNLKDYLDFDFNMVFKTASIRCLMPTKADILRFYLLSRYGGVWVDATTFCMVPLDKWIHEAMAPCSLFNFVQKNNLTRPVEAWFIASPKASPIIQSVLKQYVDLVFKPRSYSLFVMGKQAHFERLLSKEEREKPLDPSIIQRAEQHGFMPYFSVAYFFYKALKDNLTPEQVSIYLRQDEQQLMTNKLAKTKDTEENFMNSCVSKQTYLSSYAKSELFAMRKHELLARIEQQTA
ncbi:capsular polysaccharide synthesis protein [Vibrio tritonius]|uniref:capsular polysaccharide synthesis protein n=1 Tax=Vibrio tritonius TaxID=1435069 RepID=UPI000839041C|nr:capsular polysaccharide synthesis protein [Vibrio tritonius]